MARSYGELARHTVAAGRKVRARVLDLLIAATARAHGLAAFDLRILFELVPSERGGEDDDLLLEIGTHEAVY